MVNACEMVAQSIEGVNGEIGGDDGEARLRRNLGAKEVGRGSATVVVADT